MTIDQYISKVTQLYKTGNAREHSYRGDLQNLIMAILSDVLVTNEPARVECGAPDYVLTRKDVPLGYIEAKDIGQDLESKNLTEQFERYKNGLSNLIFTNYLDFHFYKDGVFVTKIAIATLSENRIITLSENFEQFIQLIKNFSLTITQTIKSPTKLAQMMAGKAKLMADVIEKSLHKDDEDGKISNLKGQMLSFKQMLIHDIDNKAFADIYAQTIAYGMFAARYHDPTLPTFSREEAATLIPKSNPFLRKLFQDIAGYDLDNRLVWIVEELVSIFLASDVAEIMKNFGRNTKQEDPVVHFYETFLGHYNKKLKIERGVWYTPQPVVNFIVRAVDDILKTEFELLQGIADTSKTKIKIKTHKFDNRSKNTSKITGEKEIEKEIHRVQILDPATGTGTFLAEIIRHVYKKFEGQQGIWQNYVASDLIPRLNGFELLMASYAMAHLKMDMLLTETGYKSQDNQRLKIFLTNSLEEAQEGQIDLFSWLADEANQANAVKRDTPVMIVMGNPPYSVSSSNKNEWIQNLIKDYKKDLNERKINLDDDYIKFTRFGQHFIDKNGSGILAYISNNSFIDGVTHRQMRKNLLESFDKIYILDLHGNSKKKEVSPDGSVDQNVFDIMAGVSINIFVKSGNKNKNELGEIFHADLYGKRDLKYKFLEEDFYKVKWNKLKFEKPYYFFVPKDFKEQNQYDKGFKIDELLKINTAGIETVRDKITIHFDENSLKKVVNDFIVLEESEISKKYSTEDARDWKIGRAKEDVKNNIENPQVWQNINYRVFDIRKTFYTGKQNGFVCNGRYNVMKHLLNNNLGLLCCKRQTTFDFQHVFITKNIVERCDVSLQTGEVTTVFPLYLYPEITAQQNLIETTRTPNLNSTIIKQIADKLCLTFVNEKETDNEVCFANDNHIRTEYKQTFAPVDLLDYIYAVLHSTKYRQTYKEFLKIDFPRIPYPSDSKVFWELVELGSELRQLHLLESVNVEKYITKYPIAGENIVKKPNYKNGNVYVNETQYFEDVPETAWNFYVGGYQPAQKWLKDRIGRTLTYDDVFHYQKMIVALKETAMIMEEIDKILEIENYMLTEAPVDVLKDIGMKEFNLNEGIYSIIDVAKIIKHPVEKVRIWFKKLATADYEGLDGNAKTDIEKRRISFHGLIELVVIGTLLENGSKIKDVITARKNLKEISQKEYPFATNNVRDNLKKSGGSIIFRTKQGDITLDGTSQFNLDFIYLFFDDIIFENDIAVRIMPSKGHGKIIIDPKLASGKPSFIKHHDLEVEMILGFYEDKSSINEIMENYSLSKEEIEAALSYSS